MNVGVDLDGTYQWQIHDITANRVLQLLAASSKHTGLALGFASASPDLLVTIAKKEPSGIAWEEAVTMASPKKGQDKTRAQSSQPGVSRREAADGKRPKQDDAAQPSDNEEAMNE